MTSPPRLYPTDLTDAEWQILEPLIPACKPGGRPPKWTRRTLCNAVLYICPGWLSLASPTAGVSALEDGLSLLPGLADRRHLGTSAYNPPGAGSGTARAGSAAEWMHHGQSVSQDDQRGRRSWLRRRQEALRSQAACAGRHAWLGAQGDGPYRRHPGSSCSAASPQGNEGGIPPAGARLAGSRLHGVWQGMDRGAPGLDGRDRAARAERTRRMALHPKRGGQAGREVHPFRARAEDGLQGRATTTLGGGAHVLLVRAEPAVIQGLRAPPRDRRSVHLRYDESHHAQETGSLMTFSDSF